MPSKVARAEGIALVLVGTLLGLALVEGGLRTAGWAFLQVQAARNRSSLRAGRPYRILCLGESTTALGGADAYPGQLERVLREQTGRDVAAVVNKGVPAIGTDWILAHVEGFLDHFRPDIVVVMMGINDGLDGGAGAVREVGAMWRALGALRTYRVARLSWQLVEAWWRGSAGPMQALPPAVRPDKDRRLRARIAGDPADTGAHVELGSLELARGDCIAAGALFERAAALDPRNPAAHLGRAVCRRLGNVTGGSAAAADAVEALEPQGSATRCGVPREFARYFESDKARVLTGEILRTGGGDGVAYDLVKMAYLQAAERCRGEGNLLDAEALVRATAALPGTRVDDVYYGRLALLAQARGQYAEFEEYLGRAEAARPPGGKPVTARNYVALRRIVRARGLRLVAVQYPLRRIDPLRRMLGDDPEVVLVDNEAPFKEVLRHAAYGEYFSDAFAGDFGHLTPKGNRLLAENIARVIRREILEPRAVAPNR